MNARVVTIIAGVVTVALGLAGLLYPDRVMGLLGFAILNTSRPAAVMGEVRATYGGLFVVLGAYTLLAAMDPPAHRSRILFIALLWLGACAGRLVSVNIDGTPGLPGWLAVTFELLIGGGLLAASFAARPVGAATPRPTAQPVPPVPPHPSSSATTTP